MQASLRVIVQIAGVLLLAASVVAFGRLGFTISDAAAPAVLAVLGMLALAVGLRMRRDGLWRRSRSDDQAPLRNDDLHRASLLDDDRGGSRPVDHAD